MQYLSPVTATEKYSCLPNKPGIFPIISDQQFQHSCRYGPIGSHVFHGEITYTYSMATWKRPKCAVFVPLASTEFRKKKHTNSTATGKFCGLAQNSVCRGKLWSLLPVDESEIWIQHTLIFVGQVPVSTQILHEVFFFLEVVIPIFNVFLVSLGKCKALQTDRRDIQTDIAWHAYTQMYIALQT